MASSREPRVAIVGATGAAGNQLVDLIAARGFVHCELKLFAGETGAMQTLDAAGEERLVETLVAPGELSGFDIAFLAAPAPRAAEIIAAHPGPLLIDLSAAACAHPDSPLVAPGLTPRAAIERLRGDIARGKKVFATPHPAAHVLATCIQALDAQAAFVAATVMLGASAGGKDALAATVDQTTDLLSARLDLEEDEVQRGFNLFMREHERALASTIAAHAAALLARPLTLSVQAVAAPVLHGSGLTIEIAQPGAGAIERLRAAPGVLLAEPGEPLGVIDAIGQEAIVVSLEERPASLSLWCVFDNTRLAALGALWIAETLMPAASTLA